jgi:hypothetical protein
VTGGATAFHPAETQGTARSLDRDVPAHIDLAAILRQCSVLRRTCDEFSELSAERNIGSAQDDAFTAAVIEGIKFAAQNVSETGCTLFVGQKEMRLRQ